ncbi:glycoside hydrolase family 3 N-terminal domain-containing protein [Tenacibaculum sp. C7A-26P2]|uniref:glycoside hydrolase family 3 N-terminal domain-containing protein n=1 Tax=Tenacibaculum sp. C7A-26P2 TaxID=3447504 RepID=UPI003F870D5D
MKVKIFLLLAIMLSMFVVGQGNDPLKSNNFTLQDKWVDSIMKSMTIDEKLGQMFMIQAYSNRDDKHKAHIEKMITEYHIGNLIFMQGTPRKQTILTNFYQERAKIPLLIGFDGEWGLDMRLKKAFRFPWNMTLGAIQDDELIKETGKRIGEHCKRIGVHINFAPVVDINTNPDNPIIGNRSFGENKENVAKKAVQFIEGMQGVGVLGSAKHFPGHGDTASDSHIELPIVDFSKDRLDSVELYPYKKVINSGVASIMVAHLSLPQIEKDVNLPSSLSKVVVTDMLKNELGYQGLIITDGLNMKGAANYNTSAEINIAAIEAGNDILLIPSDIKGTLKLLKASIKNGKITEERIDESVRKILKAKYLVGLNKYSPSKLENLHKDINSVEDQMLHRKLVRNSITVIKDVVNNIPFKHLEKKKIAYVSLGDDKGDDFLSMLKNYTKVENVSSKYLKTLLKKLKGFNTVIVGFHKSNKNPWKSYKYSEKDMKWLRAIASECNVILCNFASPYSLLSIAEEDIETIVLAYQNSKIAQELTAQALFGAFELKGRLPVSINSYKVGTGIEKSRLNRLQYTIPEEAGVSSEKLKKIDQRIDTLLKKKMTPGGQILAARNGKVFYYKSFGYHTSMKKKKVKNSDIYDLASLTKILASLPAVMKAEEEKRLSLFSSIGDLLPEYRNSNKDTLILKEILSHYGRLKSWIPFYLETQHEKTGENLKKFYRDRWSEEFSIKVADNLYLVNSYKDSISKKIKESDQRSNLGYKYSDLGYYMIREIIEKKYNKPLDIIVDELLYNSLGAYRTSYLPLKKFKESEIVPTEIDHYFRKQLLHGFVHDMGAAMLGGVGGHAGLFSNANDVAKIMQMYLQKGEYGGVRYFKEETIDKFNKRYYAEKKVRRGLGFDKPQIKLEEKPTCGCVSEESFGHSGFTGTYAWADPQSGILYVFLSNRVYPTARNRRLVKSNMRTKIQADLQNAIIKKSISI